MTDSNVRIASGKMPTSVTGISPYPGPRLPDPSTSLLQRELGPEIHLNCRKEPVNGQWKAAGMVPKAQELGLCAHPPGREWSAVFGRALRLAQTW